MGYKAVCTLPIRNWNFDITLVKDKMPFVCTLPIRNWNSIHFSLSLQYWSVCTLPIRNWNPEILIDPEVDFVFVLYL